MDKKELLVQFLIDEGYLKTPRIIDAFRAIDRTDFVLPEYKDEAYSNYPLPIGEGQTISQPLTVAFMLELLDPQPGEKILDIGAGSGWQTALLTQIVGPSGQIIAIERIPELCAFAQKNIKLYRGFASIEFYCQDAAAEIPDGPYDKIIAAAASIREIPEVWRKALKIGGKIVAPVSGSIWLFHKIAKDQWEEKEFPGFMFVPLIVDKNPKPKTQSAKPQLKTKNLFIILGAVIFLTVGLFANEIYFPHTSYLKNKTIEIEPGFGSRKIAGLLKKERIIRSKWTFIVYVFLQGKASELKPGLYEFGSEAIPAIVQKLVRGGTNEVTITIPEGWDIKEISEYLDKENIAAAANFAELLNAKNSVKFSGQFDFLKDKAAEANLEGYLFPDTYRIFKGAKTEDIIVKMLENFGKKLTSDLRTEVTRQNKSIFAVITMASLVEKEIISDQDRAIVSGILWKRLKAGIPLQIDATINYITGKKTTKVSYEETQIDSPYNTYKYRGLPKGPIANPGFSAIRAAIYPKESLYLYYLSAPDGRTIFSKTLAEHNLAKVKYLTK